MIGSAYKREDVFTIDELKALCDQSATTFIEDVLTWRESLGEKYLDLPGVRKLHDFLVVKAHDGNVVIKKCMRTASLVCGRIHHFVSETVLQLGFR